jgi:hypothetical protein
MNRHKSLLIGDYSYNLFDDDLSLENKTRMDSFDQKMI